MTLGYISRVFVIKQEHYRNPDENQEQPPAAGEVLPAQDETLNQVQGYVSNKAMDPLSIIVFIFILLFSVIFHEVAHGLVAEKLGDPTARYAGRLTLNPIPHIDLFGSILLPMFLYWATAGQFVFGAAKPVPIDYRNLRNLRRDMFLIALAGPLTNIALAFLAAQVFRLSPNLSAMGEKLLVQTVLLNIVLGVFNMIPIPPLDGSKVLASIFGFIDRNWMYSILALERFGFILIILFMFSGLLQTVLLPPVFFLLRLFLGTDVTSGF
ncbi:MAG: site-2 protease family protein [Candidatus Doudnabacteria bacterium]|nr:site-2 protease family protein [Candidatus Doudnabacteria bacterium]